jgi:GDP-L-fucose synthase
MPPPAKIYVAGHLGVVGSAIVRALSARGSGNLVLRSRFELDLADPRPRQASFDRERPEYVWVGGILADARTPVLFLEHKRAIASNVIREAWRVGVRRLLFLGSSCIYPPLAPERQHLLTGPLEPTNRPYAVAEIAGIELCWSYNRRYGTRYLATTPANIYGRGDDCDLESGRVVGALTRKFHEAKVAGSPTAIREAAIRLGLTNAVGQLVGNRL